MGVTEVDLLIFGCMVTFIAVAGFYAYIDECYRESERPEEATERQEDGAKGKLRDVA
jgi:hypothetical protein